MDTKDHWDEVYGNKPADQLSWFEPDAVLSLKLIKQSCGDPTT